MELIYPSSIEDINPNEFEPSFQFELLRSWIHSDSFRTNIKKIVNLIFFESVENKCSQSDSIRCFNPNESERGLT